VILKSQRDGRCYEAVITCDHPQAPSDGAVLLLNRRALTAEETRVWQLGIMAATGEESALLMKYGYLQVWEESQLSDGRGDAR